MIAYLKRDKRVSQLIVNIYNKVIKLELRNC